MMAMPNLPHWMRRALADRHRLLEGLEPKAEPIKRTAALCAAVLPNPQEVES
jgi:hypothetical protein